MPDDTSLPTRAPGSRGVTTAMDHDDFAAINDAVTIARMPLSLRLFLDDVWFERCSRCAEYIARSGMVRHLKDRKEAAFAVVAQAIVWRLDPFRVATATFPLPDGKIGYSGALCHAVIEGSGRLIGGVRFQHYGDWAQVRGRFHMENSQRRDEDGKPRQYPVADWKQWGEDEDGLGVKISARVKGDDEPRFLNFDLVQAYPRFSTLWATDPATQIVYTAIRRFSTLVVPDLFMGVPLEREEWEDWATALKDVTPRPERAAYERPAAAAAAPRSAEAPPAGAAQPATGKAAPGPSASPGGAAAERTETTAPAEPAAAQVSNRAAATNHATSPPEMQEPAAAAPEPKFAWIDAVGESHEFTSALDAVDDYSKALAAVADEKAREALWDNGEMLRQALHDAGEQAMGDALARQNVEKTKALAALAAAGGAETPPVSIEFDVVVPIGEMTAQAWFPHGRDRLRQMEAAKCKAADYSRFREANRVALGRLRHEMRGWERTLEKIIGAGERGEPTTGLL